MILTPENIEALTTEELSEIVWEMHKDIYGCRPRHLTTREDYLGFLEYELQPGRLVQRQLEREDEDARWALFEEEMNTMKAEDEREQLSLDLMAQGYPGEAYEHLDPTC
jgi:hypothetical protein